MIHKTTNIKVYANTGLLNLFRVIAVLLVILCVSGVTVSAQENGVKTITVSGNIKDPNNEPVIGATVKIENGTTGTVSDINGNFTLKAPANSNLLISYVGYAQQKVKAVTSLISIILEEDAAKLDEVVVVGYGQVKRANLTGAVSSLAMKEVADIPAPNLASVLSGKMPGVHVNEATGNPLGVSTINIRINRLVLQTNLCM